MAITLGPKLGLPINGALLDTWDVALRALLRALDQLSFLSVINRTTTAPPGSPANGDAYIVGVGGSGAWSAHDLEVAVWTTDNPAALSGEWEFYAPHAGWLAYSVADAAFYGYSGSAWVAFGGGGGGAVTSVAGRTGAVVLAESDITGLVSDIAAIDAAIAALGGGTLAGLLDVLLATPANGDVLTYETSSTKWKNKPAAGGGGTLAGDSDVVITTPANGDVLTYDTPSTKWKNKPASGGGGAPNPGMILRTADIASYYNAGGGGILVMGDDPPNGSVPYSGTNIADTGPSAGTAARGPAWEIAPNAANTFGAIFSGATSLMWYPGPGLTFFCTLFLRGDTDINLWLGMVSFTGNPTGFVGHAVPSGPGYAFAGFRFSTAAGDTDFMCVCSTGGADTVVSSGVPVDINTSHRFAFAFTSGGSVVFYIDGALVATISTNLPNINLNWMCGNWYAAAQTGIGFGQIKLQATS